MNTPNLDKQIERMESDKRQGINTTFLNEKLNEYKSIKEQLLIHSVVVPKGTLSCDCPKCGKEMISEWVKHHNCIDCKEHYTST